MRNQAQRRTCRLCFQLTNDEYSQIKTSCQSLGIAVSTLARKLLLDPDFLYVDHAALLQIFEQIAQELATTNSTIKDQLESQVNHRDPIFLQEKLLPLINFNVLTQAKLEIQIRQLIARIR